MQAVQQQPTRPNLFKPSLLAWRANYLASKANGQNDGTEATPRQPRVIRGRRTAARQ